MLNAILRFFDVSYLSRLIILGESSSSRFDFLNQLGSSLEALLASLGKVLLAISIFQVLDI